MVVINPCRIKVLSSGILTSKPLSTCLSQDKKNPHVKQSCLFLVIITSNFSSLIWLISMPKYQGYLEEGHYKKTRIRKMYWIFPLLCILKIPWKQNNLELSMMTLEFFCRSSHRRCFVKIGVLKNFANFVRKHLCWTLSF